MLKVELKSSDHPNPRDWSKGRCRITRHTEKVTPTMYLVQADTATVITMAEDIGIMNVIVTAVGITTVDTIGIDPHQRLPIIDTPIRIGGFLKIEIDV